MRARALVDSVKTGCGFGCGLGRQNHKAALLNRPQRFLGTDHRHFLECYKPQLTMRHDKPGSECTRRAAYYKMLAVLVAEMAMLARVLDFLAKCATICELLRESVAPKHFGYSIKIVQPTSFQFRWIHNFKPFGVEYLVWIFDLGLRLGIFGLGSLA